MKERECLFKPALSARLEGVNAKEVRGMRKFVKRQRRANETKKAKEKLKNTVLGTNWVRRITIPEGFSFNIVTPYQIVV